MKHSYTDSYPSLFGRDSVIERLLQRSEGLLEGYRQNIALLGKEGSGKTSLIHRITRIVEKDRIIVVRLLTAPEGFRSFAKRFLATFLFQALSKKGISANETPDALIECARKVFPKTHRIVLDIQKLLKENPSAAFGKLFDLPLCLHAETGWSCIVMLDEFDRIEGYRLHNPFGLFGKQIMLDKNTMYIVTSSRMHRALPILREKLNLLFGQFETIVLNGLDAASARELLAVETGRSLPDTDAYAKCAIALTGGHPLYLKILALRLREMGNLQNQLSLGDLTAVLEKELFEPDGALNQRFNREMERLSGLRHADVYSPLLTSIARGKHTCSEISRDLGRSRRDVSKQLTCLIQADFVMQNGQFYRLPDPLFRFWLRTVSVLKIRQVNPDPDRLRLAFRTSVRSYADCFREADTKTVPVRVAELFRLFRNETIRIGQRSHKLPHFQEVRDSSPVLARKEGGYWAGQITHGHTTEADVLNFSTACKKSAAPIKRKIIISQKPLDLNTRLVAKEEKIWTWDLNDLNLILELYSQPPVVT